MAVGFLSPEYLISTFGYIGLFGIVFAESGLLFGFFLPGDSLLVTAGLIASRGLFGISIVPLILVTTAAAILGDSVGYWFGRKTGPKIFNREKSLLFHKDNLRKAQEFYEKNGAKTIVLARYMPFIRTFAPIVAGAGQMQYSTFIFYNVVGGILWVLSTTLLGYFMGNLIPDIDKYLHYIIGLIIILSVTPPALHFYKGHKKQIDSKIKSLFWPVVRK
jgi:membrane-associated protein